MSLVLSVVLAFGPVVLAGVWPETAAASGHTTIILTSGTSWTVPSDWNNASNTIEVIGGGGGAAHGGGSGGAYAKSSNVALTPDSTITYAIGAAGASSTSSPTAGGDTYFCDSTSNCGSIVGSAVVAGAKGGGAASGGTGGTGGSAASSVGDVTYDGGRGGNGIDLYGDGDYNYAGGGGGSAGPNGNGGAGGSAGGTPETPYGGSGGGGGHGGGVQTFGIAGSTLDDDYDVSGVVPSPYGSAFKSDGTKLYVVDSAEGTVHQFSLSTAWDISSLSYDSVSFDASANVTGGIDITFSSDGTKMYIVDPNSGTIEAYTLSSAWNITTASHAGSLDVLTDGCLAYGIAFNNSGTSLFIPGCDSFTLIYEYALSSAWDIATASMSSSTYDAGGAIGGLVLGVTFSSDGLLMYMNGTNDFGSTIRLFEVALGSAWDITTATYQGRSFQVFSYSAKLKSDNEKFYLANPSGLIEQYSFGYESGENGYGTQDINTGEVITAGGDGGLNIADSGAGEGSTFSYTGTLNYTSATAGTSGGGGGGGTLAATETYTEGYGGDGSMRTEWTDNSGGPNNGVSAGSGGGGGGGGMTSIFSTTVVDLNGGDGGGYGSGGGGLPKNSAYAAANTQDYEAGSPGASQPGVIVITYTPSEGGGGETPVRELRLMGGVRLMNGVRLY